MTLICNSCNYKWQAATRLRHQQDINGHMHIHKCIHMCLRVCVAPKRHVAFLWQQQVGQKHRMRQKETSASERKRSLKKEGKPFARQYCHVCSSSFSSTSTLNIPSPPSPPTCLTSCPTVTLCLLHGLLSGFYGYLFLFLFFASFISCSSQHRQHSHTCIHNKKKKTDISA
ncbi:unnamed protein product [Ceratitis capitata]|uniref:(Mediterranean fruit fly) hypothetical protein n=1 Tax=Ceratitis capitata TaxID=7213 RepID=A0A811U5X6_CERCA|nr:unnamed protein product [Ceratitis capitata]